MAVAWARNVSIASLSSHARARAAIATLAGVAAALSTPAAQAVEPSCASALSIQGDERGSLELRRALEAGALGRDAADACHRAVVELRASGSGWTLSVQLGEDHVEREVESIADAAAWLESWLLPSVSEQAQPTEPDARDAPASAADEPLPSAPRSRPARTEADYRDTATDTGHTDTSPPPPAWRAGSIGLSLTTALADDRSAWGGGELGAQLFIGGPFCVGAGLGGAVDPFFDDDSAAGDDVQRRLLWASVRVGSMWDVGSGVSVGAGLGVGLVSAVAQHRDEGVTTTDDEGAALAEFLVMAAVDVGSSLALTGGLGLEAVVGLEGDEADDRDSMTADGTPMPAAHPSLFGSARVGLAYRFGSGI